MPDTTADGAPFPLATEAIADGASAIEALAEWVDGLYVPDLRTNRPAAAVPGRRFYAIDTGDTFLDTGSGWAHVSSSSRVEFASGVAGSTSLKWGTPTATGPVAFTRQTSDTFLEVGVAGVYRLTIRWQTAVNVTVEVEGDAAGTYSNGSASMTFRLLAGDRFRLVGSTAGQLTYALIERVGP